MTVGGKRSGKKKHPARNYWKRGRSLTEESSFIIKIELYSNVFVRRLRKNLIALSEYGRSERLEKKRMWTFWIFNKFVNNDDEFGGKLRVIIRPLDRRHDYNPTNV